MEEMKKKLKILISLIKKIIKLFNLIKKENRNWKWKIQISLEENLTFYLDMIYGIDDFESKIQKKIERIMYGFIKQMFYSNR